MRPQPGHLGGEAADAEGLQNLLSDADFFGAVAAGSGGERDADGVANAFLQQDPQSGARSHDAFGAHAGFRESQVQGIAATRGQRAIDVDQVLDSADLGAEDDLVRTQSVFLRQGR